MPITTPEWVKDAVFYQVFPDRFAQSGRVAYPGPLEPWDTPPTYHGFKGGDLLRRRRPARLPRRAGRHARSTSTRSSRRRRTTATTPTTTWRWTRCWAVTRRCASCSTGRTRWASAWSSTASSTTPAVASGPSTTSSRPASTRPYLDWFHVDRDHLAAGRPLRAYPNQSPAEAALEAGERGPLRPGGHLVARLRGLVEPARPAQAQHRRTRTCASTCCRWPSTGSASGRTAGAWTWPPRSTTTTFWREFRRRVKAHQPRRLHRRPRSGTRTTAGSRATSSTPT